MFLTSKMGESVHPSCVPPFSLSSRPPTPPPTYLTMYLLWVAHT